VGSLKQQLLAAATDARISAPTASTLDLLFDSPGLGNRLLLYSSTLGTPGAPGSSLNHGVSLIAQGKFIEAHDYFSNTLTPPESASSGASDPDNLLKAWLAYCRVKLGFELPPKKPTWVLVRMPPPDALPAAPDAVEGSAAVPNPVQHLAAALQNVQLARELTGKDLVAVVRRRALHAAAVGEALGFLLHPTATSLPAAQRDEALAVLAPSAPLFGDLRAAVAAANTSGSSSDAKRQQVAWDERAKISKAFFTLLTLTGLMPVKTALFELAEEVRV
jgi:hypothetical protein